MEKFRITLDRVKQAVKPEGKLVGTISNRLNKNEEVSIEEFATYMVQPNSFTWCPAVFNGGRKDENWINQQVFALDFDKNPNPEDILEICRIYGLICNVIYTSFSDTPEYRKLRVVFFLDKVVEDAKTAKFIQLNLMSLFDGDGIATDKACKDYARLFFGGKELLHLNPKTNSFDKLLILLNTVQIGRDFGKTRGMVNFVPAPQDSIRYYRDVRCQDKNY